MKYRIVEKNICSNKILRNASFDSKSDAIVELKKWFEIDAQSDNGDEIIIKNGIKIKSTLDGKIYAQEEIDVLEEWDGGEYVFPKYFESYSTGESIIEILPEKRGGARKKSGREEEIGKRAHVRALKYCGMKKALIGVSVALLISLIGNICQAGTVADTLYLEARGEGVQGIKAVASVIYNRAKGDSSKFEAVCLKPFQFSCWNGSKTRVITLKTASDKKAYKLCLQVEKELYTSNFKPLGEWTHYYNPKLCNPSWAKNTSITKIVNHNFLKTK